ncbi:hypothetical protein J4Q44_G00215500 [Coregonus suidteri]|uniref:Uncharacterized protein n=1 Tax=Coregonus suidteri TaxID=861788 RepID=A0AAN8LEZ2_9TELE
MTTDSGSNFLKAFRLYGEEEAINVQEESDSTLDHATEDQSESGVEYQDVSAILDDNTGLEYQLPRHQKCACHLLNLISTVDATAAGGAANETYKRLSRSPFAKCHALWNKNQQIFDIFLFVTFLAGVLLFIFADSLSRSQVFYYSAGMSTGMIASLIILIFIMARFLPSWWLGLLCLRHPACVQEPAADSERALARGFWLCCSGRVISFAVCYRHGPLVEERSINILSWTLQLFGLLLIYAGIQVQQVALATIVAAFCSKNLEYPVSLLLLAWHKVKPTLRWEARARRLPY